MLPVNVAACVQQFAYAEGYLAYPDEAENMCGIITSTFTDHMKIIGLTEKLQWARCFRAKDITRPHREGLLSNFHIFPVWDDTAIDFTARQFWLEADYPLVAPLDTYKTRFERVEVWPLAEMGHPRWTQDSRLLLVRHDVR